MNIRAAGPPDHEALVELQRRTSLAAYTHVFPPDRFPFPLQATRRQWQRVLASDDELVLVAEAANALIGSVAIRGPEVHSVYVSPDRWRSGVGSALLDAATTLLRQRGQEIAHLWVMRENEHARLFYEHLGWKQDGRRQVSSFPPHPELLGYERSLDASDRAAPNA